ncbi:imidazole glycerol phosphate synthase subunit HisH [Chitinolyticbacter meiyuanensis]|uniref:imidazole glycerol phosphate synthase subunit HisH n=1 Tax=Chitinolyticbacter meiyuanensis TaxID=682798 RepID=UPI0011E5BC8C|nr:imidazole glycerol phosphate synthase subunit HisH [Chitinolyticbacter meiyuanensis]
MKDIYIVDYGVGNLFSVERAFDYCGATRIYTGVDFARLEYASALVIPGVGAFGDGMQGLQQAGLIDPIRKFASTGKPVLGICLGMQMLLSVGVEHGRHEGIGLIPGEVVPIPAERADGKVRRIPSIGWRELDCRCSGVNVPTWLHPTHGKSVYLVHSYRALPENPDHVIATYNYEGQEIVAAIGVANVHGMQFHPEKSGGLGLDILKGFVESI